MHDVKTYILKLLKAHNISIDSAVLPLVDDFCTDPLVVESVNNVLNTQTMLTEKWKIRSRIEDVLQKNIVVPNGVVGKAYEAKFDFLKLELNDLVFTEFEGLSELGLEYDNTAEVISGIPEQAGDFKITLKFRVNGESEHSILNEKKIALIINPDPKSLWKNLPSDANDPFWKKDNVQEFAAIGNGKYLVVASKRGRSHANVGSFRDDDYAYKYLEQTGWSVVVVSDGAGSAKLSRKGAQLVCTAVVDFFMQSLSVEQNEKFHELYQNYPQSEELTRKFNLFIYQLLWGAASHAHQALVNFAQQQTCELRDLHATLAFALFKKIEDKYLVLTFGVGDSPIALLPSNNEVILMNPLDVGEYGGGTRFISMPEIIASDKFSSRLKVKIVPDFAYLMLFSDGIYDPKFEVEANLEKMESWQRFLADLNGENADQIAVNLAPGNPAIADQLSNWMDFWSVGNHDDRTLAIVF